MSIRQRTELEGRQPTADTDESTSTGQPGAGAGAPDRELFIRLAFGENPQKGCELLFRRYHRALCSHAVRFVYSKETAEDLVSEVFCRFWRTKAYETVTSSFRYYLFRSVRNEAYNYLRLEFQPLNDIETATGHETATGQRPDQIIQYEEILHRVEDLVEALPPQCRRVFLLSRFEGKKYAEIAAELGLSVKTVEVHIVKALGLVRQGLRDHWLTLAALTGYLLPL